MKPKPDYRGAAIHGMAVQRQREREAHNRDLAERLNKAAEAEEERRMIELASGIHSEELLQKILASVQPELRAAVEARLRPYVKTPLPTHE